jgi:hypothetical protein
MKIPRVKASVLYKDKYVVPNEFIEYFKQEGELDHHSDEGLLKLSIYNLDKVYLKGKSFDYYVKYFDEGSKKVAFRAIKLAATTITLIKKYENMNQVPQTTQVALIKSYANVFGKSINGLVEYGQIKDEITRSFSKDLDGLSVDRFKVYDIKKKSDTSDVHEFDIQIDVDGSVFTRQAEAVRNRQPIGRFT